MKKTSKYVARLLAVLAIVAVAIAVVVILSSYNDESQQANRGRGQGRAQPAKKQKQRPRRTQAKTYTVKSGDTLTAIAHKTGVPVAELQALNPEVDPQILIAGQVLKLR